MNPERKHTKSKPGTADGQAIVRRSTTGAGVRVGQTPPCLRDSAERRAPNLNSHSSTKAPNHPGMSDGGRVRSNAAVSKFEDSPVNCPTVAMSGRAFSFDTQYTDDHRFF